MNIWIIDPVGRSVLVYLFEEDRSMVFGFDSIIPVHIFGDECKINFSEIESYISFLD